MDRVLGLKRKAIKKELGFWLKQFTEVEKTTARMFWGRKSALVLQLLNLRYLEKRREKK